MERWLEAEQDKVWRGNTVKALEKRWESDHDFMSKVASLVIGKSLLDIGCGLGHLYEHIKRDITYLGVDQSSEMLTRARERYPNAKFIQQNLYELNLPKFDTVTCIDVLHHQIALEPALSILMEHTRKALVVTLYIHERYKKGKHPKQKRGQCGEIITWYTEEELKEKFSDLDYKIYRGIGCNWRYIYRFSVGTT